MKTKKNSMMAVGLCMMISIFLMACGNTDTINTVAEENEIMQETDYPKTESVKSEEIMTKEEGKQEQTKEVEPTEAPTPEPTPTVVIYEGIDMESTLPGSEWVSTFVGIIEEPKFVVVNDETNKKLIVENGQEAVIGEGDILAVFLPSGFTPGAYDGKGVERIHTYDLYFGELIFKDNYHITEETISLDIFDSNYEMSKLSCTIVPEG